MHTAQPNAADMRKLHQFSSGANHRSYQPLKPSSSKLLQLRWDETNYINHRQRVYSAKPTVDTSPPRHYLHIHLKMKKLQLEEERCLEIMKDNLTLLEHMYDVIHKSRRQTPTSEGPTVRYRKSLNLEKRKQELQRIMMDNMKIMERLMAKNSNYSVQKWQKEWERTCQLLENISSYPTIKQLQLLDNGYPSSSTKRNEENRQAEVIKKPRPSTTYSILRDRSKAF